MRVLGGARLLLAEDNPVNRLVIARQLQRLRVPAVIVEDGAAALARWRGDGARFSLLLTDLHMPGLDGETLCAAIRAEEAAGRRLPGPPWLRGVLFTMIENALLWGAIPLFDRFHPSIRAGQLPKMNRPIPFLQQVLRHIAYGAALGIVYEWRTKHKG